MLLRSLVRRNLRQSYTERASANDIVMMLSDSCWPAFTLSHACKDHRFLKLEQGYWYVVTSYSLKGYVRASRSCSEVWRDRTSSRRETYPGPSLVRKILVRIFASSFNRIDAKLWADGSLGQNAD